MSTMQWDEAQTYLWAERGRTLVDSQGDTWSVRGGQIGFADADKGSWRAWVTWWVPTVTFVRPAPEMWGKATAWAWMRAHPGEQLIDDQGDAWYADAEGAVYFETKSGQSVRAQVRLHNAQTWHAPKADDTRRVHDHRETLFAPYAADKPRVKRINVVQRPDTAWVASFYAGGDVYRSYHVFRPTVDVVARAHCPSRLDFSEAYTIVTPKPCARSWDAAIDRCLLVIDSYTAPPPKPHVTRIDAVQLADSTWVADFVASDGNSYRFRFSSRCPTVDAVRDAQGATLDFSNAFTIVTPYAKPKPRRHEWVYTVGDLYGMNYDVIAHRVLSEAL